MLQNLTRSGINKQGNNGNCIPYIFPAHYSFTATVSFDVIIPSLPGFAFSSLPSAEWTIYDTARLWNTLMVDVLGYGSYSVFGTDWVCDVSCPQPPLTCI